MMIISWKLNKTDKTTNVISKRLYNIKKCGISVNGSTSGFQPESIISNMIFRTNDGLAKP